MCFPSRVLYHGGAEKSIEASGGRAAHEVIEGFQGCSSDKRIGVPKALLAGKIPRLRGIANWASGALFALLAKYEK